MSTNYLAQFSANLSTFNAVNINYNTLTGSTITGSTITASTMTTQSMGYSTLIGSSVTASTIGVNTMSVSTMNVSTLTASGPIISNNSAALWMPSNGVASIYITDSSSSLTSGTTAYGRYFGISGIIYQDFYGTFQWRGTALNGTVTGANIMSLSSAGNLIVSGVITCGGMVTSGNVNVGSVANPAFLVLNTAVGAGNGFIHTNGTVSLATYLAPGAAQIGSVTNHPFQFFTNNGGAQMTILTNGNVGIGVTNPFGILQIACTTSTNGAGPPDGGLAHGLVFTSPKTGISVYAMAMGVDYTTGYGYINGAGNGTSQPILLQSRGGNVGIGTNNPAVPLQVYGTGSTSIRVGGSSAYLELGWAASSGQYNGSAAANDSIIRSIGGNLFLQAANQGNPSLVCNSNGNVGIGKTNPEYPLDVYGGTRLLSNVTDTSVLSTTNSLNIVRYNAPGSWNPNGGMVMFSNTYASNSALIVATGGISGLQTTNGSFGGGLKFWYASGETLSVGMTINSSIVFYASIYPATDNLYSIGSGSNRFTTVFAVTGTIQTSDSSEKDLTILPYGLTELMQMKTIMYKWKSQASLPDTDPAKNYQYYGVCADQLSAIFPELVYNEDPNVPMQLNYSEIIPVVIKAVQEQNIIVKEQATEISSLQSQLTQVLSQVAALTDRLAAANIA